MSLEDVYWDEMCNLKDELFLSLSLSPLCLSVCLSLALSFSLCHFPIFLDLGWFDVIWNSFSLFDIFAQNLQGVFFNL